MKKTLCVILLLIITISCCGCDLYVSGEKYRILQRDFEAQISLNQTMKEEMRALREELIVVRRELEGTQRELAALRRATPPPPPIDGDSEQISPQMGEPPGSSDTALEASADVGTASSSAASEATDAASSSAVSEAASASGTASSSAASEAASVVVADALPTDEKTQTKFKDIAGALG